MGSGHASLGWRCSRCSPGYTPGEDDPPEAEMRMVRNCDGTLSGAALDLPVPIGRCPKAYFRPQDLDLARDFGRWRTFGCFPFAGGMTDQPAWVADLFEEILAALATHRKAT